MQPQKRMVKCAVAGVTNEWPQPVTIISSKPFSQGGPEGLSLLLGRVIDSALCVD